MEREDQSEGSEKGREAGANTTKGEGERKKRDCRGGRNGRDRAPWKEEERASGQGMLVGSLMRLAMHAPYGSDQISDRLPSPPVSLSLSSPFPSLPMEWQSGPRLDRWVCRCIRDVETLPGYKVHLMFDVGGDVRSGASADQLTFVGSRARIKADEHVEINTENKA